MKSRSLLLMLFLSVCSSVFSQQYTGMSGLIHVPSAEMDKEGEARIGVHLINKRQTPGNVFTYEGERYNTFSYYLSITPFRWIEIGYTCTLLKCMNSPNYDGHGYEEKDRYFSLKINPLREGKWWPAMAIGCNDVTDSYSKLNTDDDAVESIFGNYYVVASKHIKLKKEELGIHLSYRYYVKSYNKKWQGIVGGVTYRPSFAKSLRVIAEYTGNDVNVGFDRLLWKHLLLQASLQDGKYFSGGVCFQINLF